MPLGISISYLLRNDLITIAVNAGILGFRVAVNTDGITELTLKHGMG